MSAQNMTLPTASDRKPVQPSEASILVVEDKVESYATVARLLAFVGVTPRNSHWKASGWGVVQFAESLPHLDLILLDIGLPYEDGYEVLVALRKDERFSNTRIVAVTGRVDEMRKAKFAGFDGFLSKPLDIQRFPQQLSRILHGEVVWE